MASHGSISWPTACLALSFITVAFVVYDVTAGVLSSGDGGDVGGVAVSHELGARRRHDKIREQKLLEDPPGRASCTPAFHMRLLGGIRTINRSTLWPRLWS